MTHVGGLLCVESIDSDQMPIAIEISICGKLHIVAGMEDRGKKDDNGEVERFSHEWF